MFISYWKSAFRNLLANRLYSYISIGGLSLGLTAFLMLGLFVREEARYDDYHRHAEHLYRVTRDILSNTGALDRRLATNSPQVAPLLLEDFPEIAQASRLLLNSGWELAVEDNIYTGDYIGFVDQSLMMMFDFEWLQGEPESALSQPNSIVLTQSVATKYFGNEPALGQLVAIDEQRMLTVTGVLADLPNHTHMLADLFVSINLVPVLYDENALNNWSNGNFFTYIQLKPTTRIESITSGFEDFLARHLGEDAVRARMHAMKVSDIHLHWTGNDMKRTSSVTANLYYFLVGLSILLIACSNFTNLSLASSLRRIREVGIRKTMGANRQQLLLQHIGEALLIVIAATLLALVLVELLLPAFNIFIRESLQFSLIREPALLIALVLVVILVSILSSLYPAFYLSRLNPGRVLASSGAAGSGKLFSKGIVVLQFSLAIFFVVTAIAMSAQMHFLRNMDTGFDYQNLVRVSNDFGDNLGERWPEFKRTLLSHPGIEAVSGGNGAAFGNLDAGYRVRVNGEDQDILFPHFTVEEDFFEAYNITLLAGRQFAEDSRDRLSGSQNDPASRQGNFILSESAASSFGWTPQQALGQTLASGINDVFVPGQVIGVVEDARFETVRRETRPMIYRQVDTTRYQSILRHLVVRLTDDNQAEAVSFIDETWNRLVPETPIQRRFVEEDFENLYIIEHKLGQLFTGISVLTVTIACMGLFGLAAYNTESRTKEIGVRKVMGSSVWGIVVLIASQFSRLVLVANLIAWPVAWYAMNLWLQQYLARISLTPAIFIGSGAVALCIAWATVGGTAAKAASRKPVLALRYE